MGKGLLPRRSARAVTKAKPSKGNVTKAAGGGNRVLTSEALGEAITKKQYIECINTSTPS